MLKYLSLIWALLLCTILIYVSKEEKKLEFLLERTRTLSIHYLSVSFACSAFQSFISHFIVNFNALKFYWSKWLLLRLLLFSTVLVPFNINEWRKKELTSHLSSSENETYHFNSSFPSAQHSNSKKLSPLILFIVAPFSIHVEKFYLTNFLYSMDAVL